MRPEEIALAVEWAAREGWNPGHHDAACFATVDPTGFLIGERDGAPAVTISCVNYDPGFAFLGFYIVRPELRGRGLGLRIWNAAIAHAGARTIGLDGVIAQQENYKKSGFTLAYCNIRYGGPTFATPAAAVIGALAEVPIAMLAADDATVFPVERAAFLHAWIEAPGHLGRAFLRDGRLAAWGVIQPCRRGHKVGPLIADDRAAAETVLDALIGASGADEIFLDVPEPNEDAVRLASGRGLAPIFETARMYTGPTRPVQLRRLFGVMSFELG
jgi:GNAT superfamily N-acetyltransferase